VEIAGGRTLSARLGWYISWLVAAPFSVLGAWYAAAVGLGYDSHAYWTAVQDMESLYDSPALTRDAYLYSPLFAQLIWPLGRLPWPVFGVLWSTIALAVFVWLLRPLPAPWFWPALVATVPEVLTGNVYALMALAVVGATSRGTPWLGPVLTKVTPGVVAVGWLGASRQWRALLRGLLVGAALVGLSAAVASASWAQWLTLLRGGTSGNGSVPWLFLAAVGSGMALAAYAGMARRPWLLAVALVLVSPTWGVNTLTLLAAVPRLRQRDARATEPAPRRT
jgi:hypothetical protein